ncbi:MAG: translation elongation factor Ts [bacterium]|nr:translation elongation factor Ts [bacterium]
MAEISAQEVMALRKKTGAGIVDCKKALLESCGDTAKAVEFLRVKGLASADKKSGRCADEGLIHTYVHAGGKLGVMLELRCESDFVARTEDFKTLAKDLCMQVAAMAPLAVNADGFSPEVLEAERRVYAEQAAQSGKPPQIIEKMVEGKIQKFLKENALVNQTFVKNQPEEKDRTVEEYIKQHVARLGENIQVARFVRFKLGEES